MKNIFKDLVDLKNNSLKILFLRCAISIGIIAVMGYILFLRGDEDTWIKNQNGEWIKHGNPSSEMPTE